jgi:hypothetical protein
MAETLWQYPTPVTAPDGVLYRARACGAMMDGGNWQGWIEFDPVGGGEPIRSPRETTQPNHKDAEYWATGLTNIYLEGALSRALHPLVVAAPRPFDSPKFDGPAPAPVVERGDHVAAHSVMDPFSVFEAGEAVLRRQLHALSAWHLVNIAREYELTSEDQATLNAMPAEALIDAIVAGVKAEVTPTAAVRKRR